MRILATCFGVWLASIEGCATSPTNPTTARPASSSAAAPAAPIAIPVAPSAASASAPPRATPPAALEAQLEPKLANILRSHQLRGVVARLDGLSNSAHCSDPSYCRKRLTPASTFKIANSIIGLETGVIADAEFVLPWDGVNRSVDAWNHDHTLRTAIRDSAVWYYQELARRVGKPRMQAWLQQLAYGNQQVGEVVDRFWLVGPLAITPLEQLDFLRRLALAQLPISERTRGIVLDITRKGELDGKTLHGKTGWAYPGEASEVGWFVGFVDDPVNPRYVAVALEPVPKGVDMMTIRQAVGEEALRLRFE